MDKPEITKRIWLFLLAEGGCWSSTGVRDALGISRVQTHRTLNRSATRGQITRHEPESWGKQLTFEVTAQCKVPDGVTVEDIKAALGG